jgi:hypothetical protein
VKKIAQNAAQRILSKFRRNLFRGEKLSQKSVIFTKLPKAKNHLHNGQTFTQSGHPG